jgi:hypothetical protein
MKDFSQICKPAQIYFAIAVVSTIIALFNNIPIMAVVYKLIFAFIWTFVLGLLCDKGYTNISWFLVALPYIMIGLAILDISKSSTTTTKQFMKSIKLQGAYGQ